MSSRIVRIYDLAQELKQNTKRIMEDLRREGADVKVPSNSVSKELADKVRNKYFQRIHTVPKRKIKIVKAEKNEIEDRFIEKCIIMSCGKLRGYLNDCFSKIKKQQISNIEIPQCEETYNKLIELLEQKLFDKAIRFESRSVRKEKCEEVTTCIEQMFAKKRQCFSRENIKATNFLHASNRINKAENIYNSATEIKPSREIILEELPWRILPQGEWNSDALAKHFSNLIIKSHWQGKKFDKNRIIKIESNFEITHKYIGEKKFEGYIVYCINRIEKVILECPFYGNATYVIKGDWKEITKVPKWVAKNRYSSQVSVIRHSKQWFENLKTSVRNSY